MVTVAVTIQGRSVSGPIGWGCNGRPGKVPPVRNSHHVKSVDENANKVVRMSYNFQEGRLVKARDMLNERAAARGDSPSWLPDGYGQISRLYGFGPSGLRDYGSATLCCKI